MQAAELRATRHLTWFVLGATALLVVLSIRGPIGSELRYVESGREMVESRDWIVPHLAYVPYFEKPILTYWFEAVCQSVFGLHWIVARLPSIVASVISVLVTYALGRDLRGAAFGLGAAAFLLASGMFLFMGSVVTTDPLFSACLAVAWWAYWRHTRSPGGRSIWAFWAALGAAVLTKGPLAIVLVGLSLATYLVLSRRLRDVLSMRLVRGAAVVLAINLPWNILAWQRDPRFLEFFYVRQNLRAFTDAEVNHAGPFWYYAPVLVGVFFPWSLVLLGALPMQIDRVARAAWTRFRSGEAADVATSLRLYCACIVVPALVFLSASGSKLSTYVMPLFPAIALLVADWIAEQIPSPGNWLRRSLWTQAVVIACVAAAAPFAAKRAAASIGEIDVSKGLVLGLAGALVVVGSIVAARSASRGRVIRGLTLLGASTVAAATLIDLTVFALAPQLNAAHLVDRLVPVLAADDRVVVASKLTYDYSINIGLGRRTEILGEAQELGMGHFTELTPPGTPVPDDPYGVSAANLPQSAWLLDEKRLAEAWRGTRRVWFIARDKDLAALRRDGLTAFPLAADSKRAIVSNRPVPGAR